jgi:hypothetical protein
MAGEEAFAIAVEEGVGVGVGYQDFIDIDVEKAGGTREAWVDVGSA